MQGRAGPGLRIRQPDQSGKLDGPVGRNESPEQDEARYPKTASKKRAARRLPFDRDQFFAQDGRGSKRLTRSR